LGEATGESRKIPFLSLLSDFSASVRTAHTTGRYLARRAYKMDIPRCGGRNCYAINLKSLTLDAECRRAFHGLVVHAGSSVTKEHSEKVQTDQGGKTLEWGFHFEFCQRREAPSHEANSDITFRMDH